MDCRYTPAIRAISRASTDCRWLPSRTPVRHHRCEASVALSADMATSQWALNTWLRRSRHSSRGRCATNHRLVRESGQSTDSTSSSRALDERASRQPQVESDCGDQWRDCGADWVMTSALSVPSRLHRRVAVSVALARHQTLTATLDWSFELLSKSERRLFDRPAVCAGGWSLEAAARMAGQARRSPTEQRCTGRRRGGVPRRAGRRSPRIHRRGRE
jgi:hypothetical protein